jgi:competence protein ComEA
MKILNSVFLATALFMLPATFVYAQTPNIAKEMKQQAVNINTAGVEQLVKLPGIGKKKAQAIVDYRQAQGEFTSVSDLMQVKGIGKKLVAKLEDKVSL